MYSHPSAFHLGGPLSTQSLRQALQSVVERHESLRTSLERQGDEVVQCVAPQGAYAWAEETLEGLPPEAREAELQRRLASAVDEPFHLEVGPALRAVLWRLQPDEHVLLLNVHQALLDEGSRALLWRELGEIYSALERGQSPVLPPLPLEFRQYSATRQAWLQSSAGIAQVDHWRRRLTPEPDILELPKDRPRPATGAFASQQIIRALDPELTAALTRVAQAHGATLFMVLLAAFKTLLHRYTGQADLSVGVPVANRLTRETEALLGCLGNTVVVRTSLVGSPTFTELLRRVRDAAVEAYAQSDVPFEYLVEVLPQQRDPGQTPFFQVLFQLQDAPDDTFPAAGLQTTLWDVSPRTTPLDLSLRITQRAGGWATVVEYRSASFSEDRMQRLLGHWETLLRGIVTDPGCPIETLPLLTPPERQQLLIDWNDTAADYPRDLPLPRIFEAVVDRCPDAIALVADHRTTTYRELDNRANQLAHHLLALGAGPGTFIGLALARSPDFVVSALAILKTGAAYVPLPREFPPARRQAMIRDAGISWVVHRTPPSPDSDYSSVVGVDLTAAAPAIARQPTHRPNAQSTPHDPAYLMYTSGSTGQPKGVVVPHRGIARLVLGTDFLPWGPDLRFLLLAPLAFDASTLEIWGPLLHGATLVVYTPEELDFPALGRVLERDNVTCLWLTAALFHQIVDDAPAILTPVRHVIAGGERLSTRHVRKALELLPGIRWVNGYGPTETTTFATTHEIRREDPPTADEPIPIGRPIANTQCLVLDRNLQPVPIGVPGELWIGGDGVALGYLGDPVTTSEKFVPLPIGPRPGERWYRTGDWVRWRPDGGLDFLGRMDRQVKLRGFRIELGEIEVALSHHPALQGVVVTVREDTPGDQRLVAYLVPQPQAPALTHADVRAFLRPTLPEYMIPAASVFLDTLPLTANGKVDRQALPQPAAADVSRALDVGRTPMETLLVEIWSSVLAQPTVSVHDNFFVLGGHSLLAAKVIARIRARLGGDLPLRILFERPILSDLADWLAQRPQAEAIPVIEVQRDDQPKLMSHEQQAFWWRSQLDRCAAVHNMHQAVRIRGALSLPALRLALRQLLERQAGLRHFFPRDGGPSEVAVHPIHDPLEFVDLRPLRDPERTARLKELAQAQARTPFDLRSDRLLRIQLVQLADEDHVLLQTLHHTLGDGWSMAIFEQEWQILYAAACGKTGLSLVPLPFQYTDYAAWQRQHLTGDQLARLRDFWMTQLQGAPRLTGFPTDRPRADQPQGTGESLTRVLPREQQSRLRQLASDRQCTPFVVLFSVFNVLLQRFSGKRDLCIGVPVSDRRDPGTQNLIGNFISIIPLRTQLKVDESFGQLLHRVRQGALEAQAHAQLPFAQMLAAQPATAQHSYNPYFQVLFNLVTIPAPTVDASGPKTDLHVERWGPHSEEGAQDISNLDIVLTLEPGVDDSLIARWSYDTSLYERSTLEFLAESYQAMLEQVQRQPETPVGQFRMADAHSQVHRLTSPQRGIWIDQLIHGELPLYNIGGWVHLRGSLDVQLFRRAVQELIRQHDALRLQLTRSRDAEGVPRQTVRPSLEVDVPLQDFRGVPDPRKAADEWMQQRFVQPFLLEGQPLFRFDLIRVADEEHFWLMQYHHLVTDGWGIALLRRSLADIYTALRGNQIPERENSSYLEFIEEDLHYVDSEAHEQDRAYWLRQIANPPEPLLEPRTARGEDPGSACYSINVPREWHRRLEQFGQKQQSSAFQVIVGALALYMGRTRSREELVFGIPALNRRNPTAKSTAGLFAVINLLRLRLPAAASFVQLLRHLKQTLRAGHRRQRFPIYEINRAIPPVAAHGQHYDVGVSYERHEHGAVFDTVACRTELLLHGQEQVPLMVYIRDYHAEADVKWDFVARRNYFSHQEIQQLQEHLLHLMDAVMLHPEIPTGQLPLLPPTERQQLLVDWNNTGTLPDTTRCLHNFFEEQAGRTPTAVALQFGDESLTYAALNGRADQLARHLRSLGVGPEVLVGLCLRRSPQLVIGLLAILKAGGAYVPLDPNYPAERIAFILQDAQAPVLLTEQSLLLHLPAYGGQTLCLDQDGPPTRTQAGDATPIRGSSDHLAYVIYTSGSMGVPKGVMVEHRQAAAFIQWTRKEFTAQELDITLFSTSVCFDLSIFELFAPLAQGAQVRLVENLLALADRSAGDGVTLLNTVPSALQELLRLDGIPASVQSINLAGEPLPTTLVDALYCRPSIRRVRDLYGPSETTTYSTCAHRTPGGPNTIGRPIAGTQIYILDQGLQPLPIGVTGELYIGGTGVARGYWRRPDLTAERFLPDPFHPRSGARFYRTGDLARHRPDGSLEYLGRIDHQVKLRGFRIELGEIEAALARYPAVQDVVVVAREDVPGNQRLVAYIVPQPPASGPTHAEVRAFLQATLPDYMIPAASVALGALPLTPNGKVDRKALPKPDTASPTGAADPSPRDLLEWRLARIWEEVFPGTTIGRNDNFFELGGHSLLAARLAARVEQLVDRRIPIAAFFHAPTIATQAEMLRREDWAPAWSSLVPLQPNGHGAPLYFVHGWGGDVYGFLNLARELQVDRPIYGIQAVGLDGRVPRHETLEAMATHYAREIRAFQPEGPYHLAGYSLGGWIAYAVAQELRQQGAQVAWLALVDTHATGALPRHLQARILLPYLRCRIAVHWHGWRHLSWSERADYFKARWNSLRYYWLRTRGVAHAEMPAGVGMRDPTAAPGTEGQNDPYNLATDRYIPKPYPGDVHLITLKETPDYHHAFWPGLLRGQVVRHRIEGDHLSVILNPVDRSQLVEALRTALTTAPDDHRD